MATTIYLLIDPRDGAVRYVGQTKNTLRKRFYKHHSVDRNAATPLSGFLREMLAHGYRARGVDVATVADEEADSAESAWIAKMRAAGCRLLNVSTGGPGGRGVRPNEATRAKMSAARSGKVRGPETRAKMAEAQRGRAKSEAHRAKLSEAVKRKWQNATPEEQARHAAQSRLDSTTRPLTRRNTSGFRGVTWDKARERWAAILRVDGRTNNLGRFATAEEAAAAYDDAVRERLGALGSYNFPRPGERDGRNPRMYGMGTAAPDPVVSGLVGDGPNSTEPDRSQAAVLLIVWKEPLPSAMAPPSFVNT